MYSYHLCAYNNEISTTKFSLTPTARNLLQEKSRIKKSGAYRAENHKSIYAFADTAYEHLKSQSITKCSLGSTVNKPH